MATRSHSQHERQIAKENLARAARAIDSINRRNWKERLGVFNAAHARLAEVLEEHEQKAPRPTSVGAGGGA
ncbi:MAG: hypothetical protein ABR529_15850 [Actinomycetota bacterium]